MIKQGDISMNWKNEAIDRLKRYDSMKAAAVNMAEELKELSERITSIKSAMSSSVTVKTSADFNEKLLNDLAQKEEMAAALRSAKSWLKVTERALKVLKPEEKMVLYRMYITRERGALDRLCEELECEISTVYRRRDEALKRFTMSLYGYTET